MRAIEENGALVCFPTGRIDSSNAAAFEQELNQALAGHPGAALILDAEGLDYISSAGLRVLLRQRQAQGELTVRNVSPAVYEIFDVTGFTSMLKVEKALRFLSVEGLELMGSGAHSAVYRLDGETILKVVKDMSLEAIRSEMQVSKQVLIHGIPTAISYDVVKTEEGYGEVYEMFHAGVLPAAIMEEPARIDEYLGRFVEMYKAVHDVEIAPEELQSVHANYLAAADQAAPHMTEAEHAALRIFLEAIPERHTFVHGDFHMGNVMLQDGELVLIDVGEAGWGSPLLDFAQTAWAYGGITRYYPERCRKVLGVELEQAVHIRDRLFPLYFGCEGEALERKLAAVDAMCTLRGLLIPFLQGWADLPVDFADRLGRARESFFPRVEDLCALVQSDF